METVLTDAHLRYPFYSSFSFPFYKKDEKLLVSTVRRKLLCNCYIINGFNYAKIVRFFLKMIKLGKPIILEISLHCKYYGRLDSWSFELCKAVEIEQRQGDHE